MPSVSGIVVVEPPAFVIVVVPMSDTKNGNTVCICWAMKPICVVEGAVIDFQLNVTGLSCRIAARLDDAVSGSIFVFKRWSEYELQDVPPALRTTPVPAVASTILNASAPLPAPGPATHLCARPVTAVGKVKLFIERMLPELLT